MAIFIYTYFRPDDLCRAKRKLQKITGFLQYILISQAIIYILMYVIENYIFSVEPELSKKILINMEPTEYGFTVFSAIIVIVIIAKLVIHMTKNRY